MKSLIMLKKVCPIIFFLLLVQTGFTHNKGSYKRSIDKLESSSSTPFIFETSNYWIDSLIKTLSIEERIGQLMMISAYASKDENHIQQIGEIVEKYNIGGVIYMKGSPAKQVQYTNYLQEKAKIPLLISIDGEWGLSMRLDSVLPFPRQMMLGAIENEGLIYDMGAEIAEQCKRIGIHINFAPVADINNNPKNPVINSRSFGENKNIVLRRSYAYMAGMQDNGILVTAKHFPGHGDTDVDSHYGLPSVGHNKKHLEQFELYPFRHLINMGLSGMMIAHLHVPALDSANLIPATLSKPIITDLLIKKYGFQGLIFTDAMNMGGVTKTYEPDEASLMAFKAGNDIILFSPDIKKSIQRIAQAIKDGEISEEELNYKCRKVLAAKHYMQLDQYRPIKEENIIQDLNSKKSEYLNHAIAAEAITLLENKDDIIPIKSVSEKTLLINIKKPVNDTFTKRIKTYAQIDTIEISKTGSAIENSFYIQTASNYKTTIVAWHGLSQYPSKQYGVEPEMVQFMNALSQETNVILVIFGNPYILTYPINYNQLAGLLVAYEDNHYTREYSAQLIFGGIEAKGKLPVSTGQYKQGDGLKNTKTRLGYIHPGMIKADQRTLDSIDTLMGQVIREKMTPGAQILCAKDGYVFYNKSFGYQTYDSLIPINDETIYDLASLTKILVTTPLLMNLYENDKIDLNNPLGYYIPLQPDKVDLKMIDM
ncbi:MAG: glycoside hydrolase family 3 N-terminal domain-containing protein, partial [Salinivirgaceae bacterium]|nr:glycoside hydrolase family 3 N-terminal domain-containing protein [Salinivirgaceae bacterium]